MNGEGDDENWLSSWEQECVDSIDAQPNYDNSLLEESNNSHRKIWNAFQDSATAIAQLYRDRYSNEPTSIWVQFQTAAGTVTSLYKESCDTLKRSTELAKQSGYQKRNSELLHWAKRKRRLIRREDLLAYLAGKPPPLRQNHHHLHHRPHTISTPPNSAVDMDPNLHTFREALARTSRVPRGADLCAFITGEMARHCKRPASPSDVTMGSPTHQKRPRYM